MGTERRWLLIFAVVCPYLPFLSLPFISDDYLQIQLAREFVSPSGWTSLAGDALYRCRSTALLLVRLLDLLAGPVPLAFALLNLSVHALNVWLITRLGSWPEIGKPTAWLAALFFAVSSIHQEAVVWSSALPELLVFTSILTCLMVWRRWTRGSGARWLWLAVLFFLLALASKESGILALPIMALLAWRERRSGFLALGLLALVTMAYLFGIFSAQDRHLHLNDGTFSFRAPVHLTLAHSAFRLFWPWGVVSILILFALRRRAAWRPIASCFAGAILALGPYAFLLYQSRVPSRHNYLAAIFLGFLIAWAAQAIAEYRPRQTLAVMFLLLVATQNLYHLWTWKLRQFERRAAVTERFLTFSRAGAEPIVVLCSPHGPHTFRLAAQIMLGKPASFVVPPNGRQPGVVYREYCDNTRP